MRAADEIKHRYKYLYHMAELGSWESIKKHGLLSTCALLDLFCTDDALRKQLAEEHRPNSVPIRHPKHGVAVVRDQKPMSDEGLRRALQDGLTPKDWYLILNHKVFFWFTVDRLDRMLNARAYKNDRHVVLTVDAVSIVEGYGSTIELCRMNSGCTKPVPHKRGADTFYPLASYPDGNWSRKEPVVELTVAHSVPDIAQHVVAVHEAGGGDSQRLLWKRT